MREELLALIGSLPLELVKLLHSLYKIIEEVYKIERDACVNLVKKLLFYSFLCSQTVIEDLLPHTDPAKYTHIYNHIINLFFQTSLRKFNDLPTQKLTLLTALIAEVAGAIDAKIINGAAQLLEEQSG